MLMPKRAKGKPSDSESASAKLNNTPAQDGTGNYSSLQIPTDADGAAMADGGDVDGDASATTDREGVTAADRKARRLQKL